MVKYIKVFDKETLDNLRIIVNKAAIGKVGQNAFGCYCAGCTTRKYRIGDQDIRVDSRAFEEITKEEYERLK